MKPIKLFLILAMLPLNVWAFTQSGNVYTVDGSSSDTQAAINAAPAGSTISFRAGTYQWNNSTPVSVHKSLTLTATPGTVTIKNMLGKGSGFMLELVSGKDGHIRLNGLNFLQVGDNSGSIGSAAVAFDRTDMDGAGSPGTQYTVITTNCTFDSGSVWNYVGFGGANGLIFSHCKFTAHNGLCGINFTPSKYMHYPGLPTGGTWNTPDTMGLVADNTGLNVGDTAQGWDGVAGLNDTYIEDSEISNGTSGTFNGDDESRIVIRHCTLIDTQVFSHGQDTGPSGNRHYEVYNCTMKNVNGEKLGAQGWLSWRGAVALVANNAMDVSNWGKSSVNMQCQQINRNAGPGACQTKYPANRQCGIGWSKDSQTPYGNPPVPSDGVGQISDPIYIWGDSGAGGPGYENYVGVSNFYSDDCGNGLKATDFIQKGRDYIVGTPRPGWVPYTYPHPLVAASGGGPTPTPAPSATPAPSPTPRPSATPTPAATYEQWIEKQNSWIRANPPTPDH